MRELKIGCGKPTGAKVGEPVKEETHTEEPKINKEKKKCENYYHSS